MFATLTFPLNISWFPVLCDKLSISKMSNLIFPENPENIILSEFNFPEQLKAYSPPGKPWQLLKKANFPLLFWPHFWFRKCSILLKTPTQTFTPNRLMGCALHFHFQTYHFLYTTFYVSLNSLEILFLCENIFFWWFFAIPKSSVKKHPKPCI